MKKIKKGQSRRLRRLPPLFIAPLAIRYGCLTASYHACKLLTCCRAYIAASRRSDRSLEARMESAKRASEIHKKRTGRYYRITEETVINEQMYEEEDDAPRYRLAANLHLPNTLLQQRAQALMSIQMENRRLLGQAVNSTLQHNAHQHNNNQAQFVSPGMMSMPQGFQYPMTSPTMYNQSPQTPTFNQGPQTPMGYAPQSPYTTNDSMRQSFHQRSASIAEVPQYRPSAPNSRKNSQTRRMSMPLQNPPIISKSTREAVDSAVDSVGSSPKTPMGPLSRNNSSYDPSYQSMGNALGPLTTELPRETRHLLDSGLWTNMDSSTFDRMMQNPNDPMYQQQPLMYNYRPNSSKGLNKSAGLDQTLSSTPPDANLNATSNNELSYGYGYDDRTSMFGFDNMDGFNAFSSGANSARHTPAVEWGSFLTDGDMFGEGQYPAPV